MPVGERAAGLLDDHHHGGEVVRLQADDVDGEVGHLINPSLDLSEELQDGLEGCLSVPGIYDGVERSTAVKVTALDEQGDARTIEAEGLLAVCIQHELDHLMGKVFVEYLSPLKQGRIKTKLVKAQKTER